MGKSYQLLSLITEIFAGAVEGITALIIETRMGKGIMLLNYERGGLILGNIN